MKTQYFISSCCKSGGLHHFDFNESGVLNGITLDRGNIRGLTQTKSLIFYVKDNILIKVIGDQVFETFKLPCHGHDIKYKSTTDTFLFAGTEYKKLYELSITGEKLREIEFDPKYWLNCLVITPEQKIIIFLSCKRPHYKEAKIVVYDENFKLCEEHICPAKDEIHSPCIHKEELYWCRSNKNLVVKADLKSLSKTEEVIVNEDGYTRGLYVDDDFIILGTSENRHAHNCSCTSNLNQGCIHTYKNGSLVSSLKIDNLEIYDILKYHHDENYM